MIDLFLAPVETPTIGRNLLGNQWYDIFVAGRDPKETTIVLAALGRYPIDGEPNLVSGPFKRLAIIQGEKRFQLSKDNLIEKHKKCLGLRPSNLIYFKQITPEIL